MPSTTNENALENAIELALAGLTRESLPADVPQAYRKGLYWIGWPKDFNKQYAIDEVRFWDFLEKTQGPELKKLEKQPNWKLLVVQRLDRMIKKYGVLHVLRKGLDVDDAHFTLLYAAPLANSSEAIINRFESNQFSITRQLRYSLANPGEEIDIVLFVNGLPVVTMELKNPWTGQRARPHGTDQYRYKRDATQPLLQFGRCLVHFAVDPDEVWMTTKLQGGNTVFLPFNQGHRHGAGNPPNPVGHKTYYHWGDLMRRANLANIIQHFVTMDGKPTDPLASRNLIFPRFHQLEVVRRLMGDVQSKGVGRTYLIQHSAGSGKSNSIAWAAFHLIEAYPLNADLPGARRVTDPLFDSVIVVTDRRLLDKQIRENIADFSQVKSIVAAAMNSADLRKALETGKRIIITTIQKFPFIVDGIADMSDKRFAVIIDEAHSSQSGSAHDNMNRVMGKAAEDGDEDEDTDRTEDLILQAIQSRKMRDNASYFAFTATPKNATLEKFGDRQADGSFKPFHLYSMKQAIEEEFILDVLANYTTFKSYTEIAKSIEDNPLFDTAKAQKRLRGFVEQHKLTIQTKAEVMVEHFMSQVVRPKKLKGKAKAMVVTQNIPCAIHYFLAIRRILADMGNPFKVMVAFTGKKMVDGIEYTEDSLNGFAESEQRGRFDGDEYRMLVVANKYLTGFDQPKLSAMYVDKRLKGVLAVQALSRLNRAAKSLGKRTEDLLVLDFYNTTDDIKAAFDPYYTATTLSKATDINVLHELREHLDGAGVYEWQEVEDLAARFFAAVPAEELSPILDVAADRFNHELGLDDNAKADFKIKSKQFVKIYGQMAAIMRFEIPRWEKLYWFLKFLIPKLIVRNPVDAVVDELLESVDLSTYGLERTKLAQAIVLDAEETELEPTNANPRGVHGGESVLDPLDEIIRNFNEHWFKDWDATPEEQRVKFVAIMQHVQKDPKFEKQYVNNPDAQNRDLVLIDMINDAINKQRRNELEMYKRYTQDEAFKQAMVDTVRRMLGV